MCQYYAFYNKGVYTKVSTDSIKCLQSDKNNTFFHIKGEPKPRLVPSRCLGYFATHPHFVRDFVRVNRQFMVRWEDIDEFSIENGVVMNDGKTVYTTTATWMPEMLKRCGLGKSFTPVKKALKPK